MHNPSKVASRQQVATDDAGGIVLWMVVYAVFMVALFALPGASGVLPAL